jgi:DNA helicase-2/ATP-dependent DNA helicase PcrA
MDQLVVTRARYRRRYGTDLPEATVASRFLEEIPAPLLEDMGSPRSAQQRDEHEYGHAVPDEDFDQRPPSQRARRMAYSGPAYNSIENIAEFFASRGKKFTRPGLKVPQHQGARGFRPGMKVRHPKYGEGTVYNREGEGDDAKITVQFSGFGLKKLVEKFAQLEPL